MELTTLLQKGSSGAVVTSENVGLLHMFVEHSPAAIAMLDKNMNYLVVSRRWLSDYHLGDHDITGCNHYEIFPEVPERWKKIHQQCLAGASEKCDEDSFTRTDGRTEWIKWEIQPWYTPDSEVGGIIMFTEVITEQKLASKKLEQKENSYAMLLSNLPGMAYRCRNDKDWTMEFISNGCKNLTGYEADEFTSGKITYNDIIHQDDQEPVWDQVQEAVAKQEHFKLEYRVITIDGQEKWVWEQGCGIFDNNGNILALEGFITDISSQKHADDKIKRLNRMYAVTSGINTLIVRARDRDELFNEACQIAIDKGNFSMVWIGLYDKEKQILTPVAWAGNEQGFLSKVNHYFQDNESLKYITTYQAIKNREPAICNDISRKKDTIWKEEVLKRGYKSVAALPILDVDTAVGVVVLYAAERDFFDNDEMVLLTELYKDISYALQNIKKGEKIEFLASYDHLTSLPNRALFNEHLNSVLNRARKNRKKVGLFICDIKQFRNINNVYGKVAGDKVLQEISTRLLNQTSDPVNVGKVGSDQFAMILHDVHEETSIAHRFENSLFPALEKSYEVSNKTLRISFSGGVSVFPHDGNDAETLFRNAEAALKKTKQTGDQYLFYQPDMTARIAENLKLETKLHNAINEDQYVLFYQPKLDSLSRKITGLEALIRWNDPDTGLVPPMKFIPILEETGMILDVGLWAIDRAATQYRAWKKEFANVPRIAVNVSPIQLHQKYFVEQVEKAIRRGGRPVPLDLEITETVIMSDIEENINKFKIMRMAGLGVAIDDFGTGYSSLSYLSRLPVNALKIDRSFITNMTKHSESMTIISSIITLAHSLKLKVIAEGVETEEQAKFLTLLKCDEMQGYLFSKPLPVNEIHELFSRNNC